MLNPAEPNVTREIRLLYVTDENGDMEITVESSGFEKDPASVPIFLTATLDAFVGDNN